MIFDEAKEEFRKSPDSEREDFDSSLYKCATEKLLSTGEIFWYWRTKCMELESYKVHTYGIPGIPMPPLHGEINNASFDTIEIQFTITETAEFHDFTRSLRNSSTVLSEDLACDLLSLNNELISLIHAENLAENFICPSEDSFCSDFFIKSIFDKCPYFQE